MHHGYHVGFPTGIPSFVQQSLSTVELVNALEQEKANGKAGKIAEALTKTDLVILPSRCLLRNHLPGDG